MKHNIFLIPLNVTKIRLSFERDVNSGKLTLIIGGVWKIDRAITVSEGDIDIYYVHELQKLYFNKTGKKMRINDRCLPTLQTS